MRTDGSRVNAYVVMALLSALLMLALQPVNAAERYPLEPVDTSSPRATLTGFLAEVDKVWRIYRDRYWHSPSQELKMEIFIMNQPYTPGQRIVVQGHDGFVEQIGLRSTKIRMLNGSLAAIPNEKMANLDIENIGRRNFIRRQTNIRLAYNRLLEMIEQAVAIIKDILADHEGMRPGLPPRVFFDEFNPDTLNIAINYWYHPPLRWIALAFDEQVNLESMRCFGEAGIKLAPPTSRVDLAGAAHAPGQPAEPVQRT
ncbi:MAG: mechanosensitive ion channel domain-containing protein [Pseudomonadota bacterium]